MRQKRAKAYRKLMHLYCMSFGFRQPYQVLVDSEMCKSAVAQKLDFVKQLYTVLQGEVKPMITQCCIHELYLQGKEQQPAVDLAKTFERRKCNHREAIPGDECLSSVIGDKNKHRYVIATQSHPLRVKLRTIPAAPIVHINRSVMVLEPPSDVTLRVKEANEEQTLHATAPELASAGPSSNSEPPRKSRKGPKGPNPLSVKKKKANDFPAATQTKPELDVRGGPRTGTKRKSREADEGSSNGEEDEVDEATHSTTKKKRKRRRKTLTAQT
ncbi:Fcf1-domain-containing protein [Crassisporium funariophilum]|nr:Fcf1-domain-containing protein [Crassisporium funariophilum]